jgi:hypothetical protein
MTACNLVELPARARELLDSARVANLGLLQTRGRPAGSAGHIRDRLNDGDRYCAKEKRALHQASRFHE